VIEDDEALTTEFHRRKTHINIVLQTHTSTTAGTAAGSCNEKMENVVGRTMRVQVGGCEWWPIDVYTQHLQDVQRNGFGHTPFKAMV
jgi:hypothetical protein